MEQKFNIDAHLRSVIKESLGAAKSERDKQLATTRGVASAKSEQPIAARPKKVKEDSAEVQPTEQPQPDQSDEKPQQDAQAMKKAEISTSDVVDKLNTIRSGKSFKDSAVKSAMEKYIDDLDDAEKTALFTFLKGIAQIVTGEISGDVAVEPSDKPANVKMEKEPTSQEKRIKPNVIKGAAPKKSVGSTQPEGDVEDTSAPKKVSPITPKRRGA